MTYAEQSLINSIVSRLCDLADAEFAITESLKGERDLNSRVDRDKAIARHGAFTEAARLVHSTK